MDNFAPFRDAPRQEQLPRRRGPGPAVLLVGVYALLFAFGLWLSQSKSPLLQKKRLPEGVRQAPDADPPGLSRAALLEAANLAPLARAEYFLRLSADCCPCGCDLNLRDCLLSDQICIKSPPLARAILQKFQ